MLELSLSSIFFLGGFHIISTAKTASKKVGNLIHSFPWCCSLYLQICHLGWSSRLQLESVRQTTKMGMYDCWSSWTLESQNVVSLNKLDFGRCSSKLAKLVPVPFSCVRSICYSDKLHDFSVPIPRCHKDVYVNSFFSCTVNIWISLPIEWFHFTSNLNSFKSRINWQLLYVGTF